MYKSKSAATSKSDGANQLSIHSTWIVARSQRRNFSRVQDILFIWLDRNIDGHNPDCRSTIIQLRQAVSGIKFYTDDQECIQFINNITDNKACMIISGSLGQHIMPRIHNMSQVHSIFIFCGNKKYHEQWAKDWPKIKGVFTEIAPICKAVKQTTQKREQNAVSISFVATGGDISKKNLDKLDPVFMYSQILKEILLKIKFGEEHIQEFTNYCRILFSENDNELMNVTKLQREYHTQTPVWWYTYPSFLHSMLNCALRLMDINIIIKMGFFIGDLHRHIEQLHFEQFASTNSKEIFTLYRGQGMLEADFTQMKSNQGGLISFNNFLSTSTDRQVSYCFAELHSLNPDLVGVLFIIKIDPTISTAPFASIRNLGYYGDSEDEFLFSMHTVFRIDEIRLLGESRCLFQVNLTLTSDNDNDLLVLAGRIREETHPNEEGWYRLCLLLLQMGEYAKAQQVCEILLEQTTNVDEKGRIYHLLGLTKNNQAQYNEAITLFEKSLNIYQKTLSPTKLSLNNCYKDIGTAYFNMGNYSKALTYYEKELEIRQQSLPSNHSDLGSSYNNIGLLYYTIGDYRKALSFHEKALEIRKQSLPSNHSDFGFSYSNIGDIYYKMGDYEKALSYYEKALEIRKQSLPANHPNLGSSYNNIGSVYYKMGAYPKALSFHEKTLEILQQSLPSNHPDLGASYNQIGLVYDAMGDYGKALLFHEKGLDILQKSLPSNHPILSMSYNNIGLVYYKMSDFSKALSYYEIALKIKQQVLPPNHPHLGISYNNIGAVYNDMGDYGKALLYYEKALDVQKQSFPPNHPDLGGSYNNIGNVYFNMGDYSKARSFYDEAVKIGQHSLLANHPHLQSWKENLDIVNKKM